jgi:hypothetical protein
MRVLTFVLALAFASAPQLLHAADTAEPQAAEAQPKLLDAAALDQLVAPIALYPDTLLAQVLMAATYPLEVVQAARWQAANKKLKGDKLQQAADKQDWDASVKALVTAPNVLTMMNDQLDWTTDLGNAMLAQQADVMDAIQRLRAKAQDNGKLATNKQQTVSVAEEGGKQVIVIEPTSPETVYVPYYEPQAVYGTWPYPDYPPYYFPPASGWVVGGAIASGIAWGAAFAIGNEIWDNHDYFDWGHGDINVDIDRNVNIDRNNINAGKWEHNSYHRRGVNYDNNAVRNKFAKAGQLPADRKLDYRGRGGDQVLKPGQGGLKPGDGRPDLGGKPDLGKPGKPDLGKPGKPDMGQIEKGLKDRSGAQAALKDKKPDLGGGPKAKQRPGGNALDLSDGPKAKDFSKRGQASLGNRGAKDFARPKGGGGPSIKRGGGGPSFSGGGGRRVGGGGGGGFRGGGGGGRGGGGRGGGGRRSDIQLKEDVVPLMQLDNGLELYRFRYKGSDHTLYVGVMAQEVQRIDPGAVSRDRDGHLLVDYDRLGLKFMTWEEWVKRPVGEGVR